MNDVPSPQSGAPDPQKANKAKLAQERSRATRRMIVRSALQLWNSRGFDEGFETTTVDEIADNAGFSRATVYYHFAKKEDILRELAWVTAEEIYECALRSMISGKVVDEVLAEIMVQLGTKVSRSSPAAVKRMLQLQPNDAESIKRDIDAGGLTRAFSVVVSHAQELGELPRTLGALDIAETISAAAMGAISKWSAMAQIDLIAALQLRTRLILAGARAYVPAGQLQTNGPN
jgi:AcrR family transcriptional regulator